MRRKRSAGCRRPTNRRAANQREGLPSAHSITSSALPMTSVRSSRLRASKMALSLVSCVGSWLRENSRTRKTPSLASSGPTPITIPAGSRTRQKPLNYRTQSLQRVKLLRRASFGSRACIQVPCKRRAGGTIASSLSTNYGAAMKPQNTIGRFNPAFCGKVVRIVAAVCVLEFLATIALLMMWVPAASPCRAWHSSKGAPYVLIIPVGLLTLWTCILAISGSVL